MKARRMVVHATAAALMAAIPLGLDTASGAARGPGVEVSCDARPRPLAIVLADGRRICYGRGMSRTVDLAGADRAWGRAGVDGNVRDPWW